MSGATEINGVELQYLVLAKGRMLIMTYRLIGITDRGHSMWNYRPDYYPNWIPVRNPDIVKNLNNGRHPRELLNT